MSIRPLTQEIIDERVSIGVWLEQTFHRMIEAQADANPDAPALRGGGEKLTYEDLVTAYQSLGTWLMEQGLEAGDVVALQAPNHVATPIVHMACDYADLMFLPIASAFREREVGHLLKVARAKIVIVPSTTPEFDFLGMIDGIRGELPDLRMVGEIQGYQSDFSLDDMMTLAGTLEPARNDDPNRPTHCMITSGTTELSRISPFSDNDLWGMLGPFLEATDFHAGDVAVGIAPANTGSTGYIFPVLAPLLVGGTASLLDHWEPRAALELMEREQATHATAIPTQIVKMLQHPDAQTRDFSNLRVFSNAGAPLAPESARELERTFDCRVQTIYGATDGGVPVMTWFDDPDEKRYSTVGRVLKGTDFRLVDAELNDVPVGQPGEILWRNGTKSFGYLNDPERTAAAYTDDGYYRSGDMGQLDEDGYLQIVGRVKDMILRGGQNISPREVEELLLTHPSVAEVAVVGLPDPVYGERACACVVVRPGESLAFEEMTQFLGDRSLERFKLPEFLELFDALPMNTGGKIAKGELRDAVSARHAAAPA